MKRCTLKGCKKKHWARGYCHKHYFTQLYNKRETAEPIYYASFLKRETINEKEYLKFRKIWKHLDQEINVRRHKQSIVEIIMRKTYRHGASVQDPI